VIHHFLTDFTTNGTFTGFPALGIKWQRMESAFLRCGLSAGLQSDTSSTALPTAP